MQHGHVNTFHRSTSSVGFAGANGDSSVTRAATKIMHDLRRNFPLHKEPYRWVGMASDLEESNLVEDGR